MDFKQAQAELGALAGELAQLPLPGALDLSRRVLATKFHMAEGDEKSDEKAAQTYLDTSCERMPRKAAWWVPPHNLLLNQTLMGRFNAWRFTILPFFAKATAYKEALGGIVIHPIWVPADDRLFDLDEEMAKRMVGAMRKAATIQEDARQELAWMEHQFSIRIPDAIKAKVLKDTLAAAKRRWGVDRLRVKDRLIPLDGSAPRDL
jgi:hypothetical protein